MGTVPLKELSRHVGDASKIIADCIASDEAEPGMSFADLRKSLKSALKLLDGEAPSGAAADSARRSSMSVGEIFPGGGHPYRHRPSE